MIFKRIYCIFLGAQRLALVAGGRAETRRRNGENAKPRKLLENAPHTHLSTARRVSPLPFVISRVAGLRHAPDQPGQGKKNQVEPNLPTHPRICDQTSPAH